MKIADYLQSQTIKIKDIAFQYPNINFSNEFGCLRSGELVVVASGANQGKTTFVHRILEKNKDKDVAMINMEFDLEDGFRYEYLRAIGTPENKLKIRGTSDSPFTEQELFGIQAYIDKRKQAVEIHDMSQKSSLVDVMQKIRDLVKVGKKLIAIDSLTSIDGVADGLDKQVEIMQRLRNLCTETGVCIILIHHFNKTGKTFSGSAKIKDLANVMIEIHPMQDVSGDPYRLFSLTKDKAYGYVKELHLYFVGGNYVLVSEFDQGQVL